MKKFFGVYDLEEEKIMKNKLISCTGIDPQYINFLEVHTKENEFMHVIYIDDTRYQEKKDLVLVHGLSLSSLCFFKLFGKLSRHFRIYGVDIPNMGCSSRNEISYDSLHESEEFFIKRMEINLKKFILCAHSFGAYLSSLFTIRHKEMVEKLILLSPVGVSSSYQEIVSTRIEDFMQELFFKFEKPPNLMFKLFGGVISNYLFNTVCNEQKFKGLTDKEEFNIFKNFLNVLFRKKSGSDQAVFKFFNKNLQAYKPLTYHYEEFHGVEIIFLYGDCDWCPLKHAEEFKELLGEHIEIDIVSQSGHLMFLDNYDETAEKIIAHTFKETKENFPSQLDSSTQATDYRIEESEN